MATPLHHRCLKTAGAANPPCRFTKMAAFDNNPDNDDTAGDASDDAIAVVRPKRSPHKDRKGKGVPRYNVILWDSDSHTFDYVERMLRELFGHTQQECQHIAKTVDVEGRAVVFTTTLEHAELKRDQIHAYGKDEEEESTGSMWATVEAVD